METISIKSDDFRCLVFKSYYVVWKQKKNAYDSVLQMSLNRTMQYGNFTQRKVSIRTGNGLNRTMQYGNSTQKTKKKRQKQCLNRTMQYGNKEKHILCRNASPEFKSYYVVWKLRSTKRLNRKGYRLNRTMQYGNIPVEKPLILGFEV